MISFKGELSDRTKAFVRKKHEKAATILSIVESLIFSIPVVLLGIFWHPIVYVFLLAWSVFRFLILPFGFGS